MQFDQITGMNLEPQPHAAMVHCDSSDQDPFMARRLIPALLASVLVMYGWVALCIWYVGGFESIAMLCTNDPDPMFLPPCPEPHPHERFVFLSIPIVGPLLSVLTAALLFRFPLKRAETWGIFLLGAPMLAVFILYVLMVTLLLILVA